MSFAAPAGRSGAGARETEAAGAAESEALPVAPEVAEVAVAHAPVAMMQFDRAGMVVTANAAAAAVFGPPARDLLGCTTAELTGAWRRRSAVSGDAASSVAAAEHMERCIRTVLDTEGPLPGEEIQLGTDRATGTTRVFSTSWTPLTGGRDNGEVVGVAVAAVDVSRQKAAENQLRRSEARYRSLVESTGLDVWTADRNGRLTSDTSWADRSADVVERLRHGGWVDLVHPEDRARVQRSWSRAISEGEPYEQEYRAGLPTRGYRRVVSRGVPVWDGTMLVEFVGTTHDVTALRASEQQRAEAFLRARNVSLLLQRAMLPSSLPQTEGLAVRTRYVPGELGVEVGGDWFDVIPLSAGRVALVLGDVMGRGIQAATIMGQVRSAVRAYAALDMAPEELMGHASRLVADLDAEPLVTAVYAIHDPWEEELQCATAGHPTPMLKVPDGTVRRLCEDPDPPLGVTGTVYRRHSTRFEPGSVLALYSDGLVESRSVPAHTGIRRLAQWLKSEPVGSLDELADDMIDTFTGGDQADDVAILLAAATGTGSDGVASYSVSLDPRGLKDLRIRVADGLRSYDVAQRDVDDAVVVANELVTNALVHGERRPHDPAVTLRLRRTRSRLHLEVFDPSPRRPMARNVGGDAERGRGLALVESLAERWGTRIMPSGKFVWCTLHLSDPD